MTSYARNTHCVLSDVTENAEAIRHFVATIPAHLGERDAIVVAAPSSLIHHLQNAISAACQRDQAGVSRSLRDILEIQHALISQTLGEENAEAETARFLGDIQSIIQQLKQIPDRPTAQHILSMGEIWTARLLAENLLLAKIQSEMLVTTNVVRTRNDSYLGKDPSTRTGLQNTLAIVPGVTVLPAVATDELGHNVVCASNHFATFVSQTLNSHSLTTWTDSDGVKSSPDADIPNHVVESLSTTEVAELSRLSHSMIPSSTTADIVLRSVAGECHTQITETPNPAGVKLVHTLDAVKVLHVDCTGQDVAKVLATAEASLAKVGIQPLATDVDKEGDKISLAFPANMAEYVRGVLRIHQFKAMSIEDGKALVAIVGDGLESDWLLSFKFQQTLGASICMTGKTDVSHVAIVESPTAANDAVPNIHAELILQDSPIAESSF